MKPSRFNFELVHGNDVLIFNCRTCGLAKLDGETILQYKELMKSPQSIPDDSGLSKLAEELSRGKFLVEDGENELENLKVMEMASRFNTDTLGLTIVPTLDCNFNCIYCYEMKQEAPKPMSEEIAKKLVHFLDKKLISTRSFRVAWYGGEPLLATKRIFNLSKSFIELCDKHECSYAADIISNCYLLKKSLAKKLKEDCRIMSVQATLDGPQKIHNKRRPLRSGEGSFRRITENLKEICDSMSVNIRVNVDTQNIEYIPQLLDFLSEEGLKETCGIYFARTDAYTEACKSVSKYCYTDEMYSEKEVGLYKMALSRNFKMIKYPRPLGSYCGAVSLNSFIVDPDGNFHKCWNTVGDEREIVGNLDQPEIYSQKLFRWLSWDSSEFEECRECTVFPICKGGCPYRWLKENKKTHCEGWKYNLLEMLKLFYLSHLMNVKEEAEKNGLSQEIRF
jgi:uncharacterized protein